MDMPGVTSKRDRVLSQLADNRKAEFREFNSMNVTHDSQITKDSPFQFMYAEISAKTGEGLEEAIRSIVENVSKEKSSKRVEAKRERDFGTTVIYNDKNKQITDGDKKNDCCKN